MKIQPLFPIIIMLVILAVLFGTTVIVTVRNQIKTREKIFSIIRLGLIFLLVFCIGLRPVTVEKNYEFSCKNLDVLFVVDTTISMWAEDYHGRNKRMDGVKKDVAYILDELAGSNFALVTFDDQTQVLSPFTQDMQYIENLMDTLSIPDSYIATGSDLTKPYKDIESLLLSSSKKENRKTIIFYISDGEITNGKKLNSYSELSQYVDAGAVLGYGTKSGGKMREDNWGYIYDYETYSDAVSKIDEENLKQIAADLDIPYLNVNGDNASIKGTIELIKETSKTITEQGKGAEIYKDTYYLFAIPLALLLLLELIVIVRKGRL